MDSIVRVSTQEAKILAFLDRADLLAKPVPWGRPLVTPNFFALLPQAPREIWAALLQWPVAHMVFFPALPALGGFGRNCEGHQFLPTFAFPLLVGPWNLGSTCTLARFVISGFFGGSACSQSWLGLVTWFLLLRPRPVLGCLLPPPQSRLLLLDGSSPLLLAGSLLLLLGTGF